MFSRSRQTLSGMGDTLVELLKTIYPISKVTNQLLCMVVDPEVEKDKVDKFMVGCTRV